jgi:RNA polymerase sigma-70 factor (ECF subfamily)
LQNIKRYAYYLTYNSEKANDLLQETCLKALNYRDRYVEVSNFKAWVLAIMKNTFINNYRKSVREKTNVDNTTELVFLNSKHESSSGLPETELDYKEINKAIDELDDKFRYPFRMYLKGYNYNEIAVDLDLKVGTVKSRIFFARKKLMDKLADYR